MDKPQILKQFGELCRAVQERNVMLLECEMVDDGAQAVFLCAVRPINNELRELVPLARLLDLSFGSLVVPDPAAPAKWSPEQN